MDKKLISKKSSMLVSGKHESARIVVDKDLHKRFHQKCLEEGFHMKELTENLIRMYLKGDVQI
jgi:hypothetical protein